MTDYFPQRIVCLTEETTEMLYLLGQQHRIVGISGFTVRPPQARKEKPRVSAFTSAKIDRILELKPDLVLGFSDLQADIAAALIRQGVNVHVFNQRSVDEILAMLVQLGAMVGAQDRALAWVREREAHLAALRERNAQRARRPRVYFEEWYDPIITSIQWVAELVELAGGENVFPEHARESLGKNRILADPLEVARRQPDIIIGSWCGRKFRPEQVAARQGWQDIPAVCHGRIYEIKSADILQPGPAALTDGLDQLCALVDAWRP
ncbi:iron complex transport system substrate-binding protein [Fluviicoccus keumensis]|uniref:Iron complex transport system substrate-binding protein n=1 Tax=Fluviicoccus keumensis TaxID=1435465 RepID=A0A4Q7ZBL3_9GAMM|nr:cobalamin-binding protein [Fluviicoccus keumensis]RZU47363.1 iron complex transport system substrate-binding protein [Fluviicoccus keumensis]